MLNSSEQLSSPFWAAVQQCSWAAALLQEWSALPSLSVWPLSPWLTEIVATFIFVLVVLGTTDSEKGAGNFAGLAIGLSLVLIHLVCINLTGTSVNPARSIGPALFVGGAALSQLYIFIVAPLAGGALAALVWKLLK